MNKITYVENKHGQYFAMMNTDILDKEIYPKQVKFENVPQSEFEFLVEAPIEEIQEKIKKIIQANYD